MTRATAPGDAAGGAAVSGTGDAAPDAAALALVPGLEAGGAPLRTERLAGGTVNDSWRIDTSQGRFVLRLDGAAWRRPGVDRERERRLHDAAAAAGLAPRVLRRSGPRGAQVSEFLDGRTWTPADLAQPAALARLSDRLAQLHGLEPPAGVEPFDPQACARDYLRRIDPAAPGHAQAQALAAAVDAAARRVEAAAYGHRIIHGDLATTNLLDGAALWLLDWEYAQLGDPAYDLGCLLAYHAELRPRAPQLLAASGLGGAGLHERLDAAIEVYEALSRLWQLARDAGS